MEDGMLAGSKYERAVGAICRVLWLLLGFVSLDHNRKMQKIYK